MRKKKENVTELQTVRTENEAQVDETKCDSVSHLQFLQTNSFYSHEQSILTVIIDFTVTQKTTNLPPKKFTSYSIDAHYYWRGYGERWKAALYYFPFLRKLLRLAANQELLLCFRTHLRWHVDGICNWIICNLQHLDLRTSASGDEKMEKRAIIAPAFRSPY